MFSGTIPSSYSAFSTNGVGIAYNPSLVGTIPPLVKIDTVYGQQGGTAYTLMGTSIGLDRPMGAILMEVARALDPSMTILYDWVGLQPCPPLSGFGTPNHSPTYAMGGYTGVTCAATGGITAINRASLGLNGTIPIQARAASAWPLEGVSALPFSPSCPADAGCWPQAPARAV
jgi:hypothetical protein